jgi:hypothetical protein
MRTLPLTHDVQGPSCAGVAQFLSRVLNECCTSRLGSGGMFQPCCQAPLSIQAASLSNMFGLHFSLASNIMEAAQDRSDDDGVL